MAKRVLQAMNHWNFRGTGDIRKRLDQRENIYYNHRGEQAGSVHVHCNVSPQTHDTTYFIDYRARPGPPALRAELNKRRGYARLTVRCRSRLPGYDCREDPLTEKLRQVVELTPSVSSLLKELGSLAEPETENYQPCGGPEAFEKETNAESQQ